MFKGILSDIDTYFDRDPAMRSRLEVVLCYPGFHILLFHRLAHKLWQWKWRLVARWISQVGRFFTGIEIHPGATIGKHLFIDHGMGVVIGETATIGDDVTIYHGVTLGGTSFEGGVRHPQIANNVIIGAGSQLLGPITVAEGARIGSNAVVVKDVDAHATMVGIPARKVERKEAEAKAEAKEGFSAYATPSDGVVDPRQKLIDHLLSEVETLCNRVQELEGKQSDKAAMADKWDADVESPTAEGDKAA